LHFKAISDSVARMPVILYNIKGRTGVNLETSTLCRIVNECGNVVGVKEASGDLNQIQEVIESKLPSYFSVLSGDDNLTSKVIQMGGTGVISVLSNLFPKSVVSLVDSGLKENLMKLKKLTQTF
jgi:4-hydroxy-tetrahydrodipicolinate synthase